MSASSLSFTDHLTGTPVSLVLDADGKLQSPEELRTPLKRPIALIKAEAWFFTQHLSRCNHRRQEALPPLGLTLMFTEFLPFVSVLLMFRCVAITCHRLATTPSGMHMIFMSWSWAEAVMKRVTRGRLKRVQVRLQRRACCAVRCACRASACVRCVFDACCSKRWLVLRCVAAHCSGCIKRTMAFILVCRLLLPPALQADAIFWTRQQTETAFRCFAM